MSKKIVGLYTPTPKDSTSMYRCWGPWSQLKDECDFVQITLQNADWVSLSTLDVLFMHRPATPQEEEVFSLACDMGIPVWLDFDDDLFNIDPSNKAFEHYQKESTNKALKKMLGAASVVTCSTPAIAQSYSQIAHAQVIRNEIPIHLLNKDLLIEPPYNNKVVCWRGTDHHVLNIVHYREDFKAIAEKEIPVIFMGFRPYPVREFFKPGQMMEILGMNQWQYFERIKRIKASVHMVPLKPTKFNVGKSNIAYQESLLFGGSLCVVPQMPEWDALSGVIVYQEGGLAEAVERAYRMTDKARMSMTRLARNQLLADLEAGHGKRARLEILRSL